MYNDVMCLNVKYLTNKVESFDLNFPIEIIETKESTREECIKAFDLKSEEQIREFEPFLKGIEILENRLSIEGEDAKYIHNLFIGNQKFRELIEVEGQLQSTHQDDKGNLCTAATINKNSFLRFLNAYKTSITTKIAKHIELWDNQLITINARVNVFEDDICELISQNKQKTICLLGKSGSGKTKCMIHQKNILDALEVDSYWIEGEYWVNNNFGKLSEEEYQKIENVEVLFVNETSYIPLGIINKIKARKNKTTIYTAWNVNQILSKGDVVIELSSFNR